MEVLITITLLFIGYFLFRLNRTLASKLDSVERELAALRKSIAASTVKPEQPKENIAPDAQPQPEKQPAKSWESGFKVVAPPISTPSASEKPTIEQQRTTNNEQLTTTLEQRTTGNEQRSFLERHPDLERFIGENITSKIGIGILVLAIAYFVKYAIENEWIAETGRVAIGLLCGGILTALAHRMRNSYAAFSSVLVGGGLAIFYFTITLAYHEYHLFSQVVTFIIMVAITAFAVVLSQLYNRQELAVIALIGGFATPFMASSGGGNYNALFIYLIILNTGLLVIAYFKAWRVLNILAFLFTVILFASWIFTLPAELSAITWQHAIKYGTIFYLLFLSINLAHNIRENKRFLASDFFTILSNTCLYFSLGIYCLTKLDAEIYRGLFTASLAIFNLVISIILFQKRRTDPNILYLLIGITVSLVSLTAPIQLQGNSISLFWATELVLLYWLYQKSKIRIMQLASLLVWIALLISVTMDWLNFYESVYEAHRVIFNKGFVTTVFAGLACAGVCYLRNREVETTKENSLGFFPGANLFFLSASILFYAAGYGEISYQFDYHYPGTDIYMFYVFSYSLVYLLCFRWIVDRYQPLRKNKTLVFYLCILALLVHLTLMPVSFWVQERMLTANENKGHFFAHWSASLFVAIVFFQLASSMRKSEKPSVNKKLVWLLCTYAVIFLSLELLLGVNLVFYSSTLPLSEITRVYVKTALPILWGVCSFAFMWLGMKYKFSTLRVISLTLFTLTLAKLFLFDIRHIPVAGKIAAFFCLGVLLLIISFMYQRVKKIIVEENVDR